MSLDRETLEAVRNEMAAIFQRYNGADDDWCDLEHWIADQIAALAPLPSAEALREYTAENQRLTAQVASLTAERDEALEMRDTWRPSRWWSRK